MDAIGEERRIQMEYFSVHSQKKKTYRVHPYRLMYYRGGLYLFGYVEEYDQIRTFAVERIESLETLDDTFEKPSDFSVESYLESSFGLIREDPFDVEILFKANIASYVRSRAWHPSQKVRDVGNGEVVMTLHVGGEFELVAWVLSFGSSALVLSPDKLRKRIESELARSLDLYRVEVTVAPSERKGSRKRLGEAQSATGR
jgi:proteasome accessory factor B